MDHTIDEAINVAREQNKTIPDNLFCYMDDIYCTIDARQYIHIDPRVKFTHEEEVDNKLAFLDVLVTRNDDGTVSTSVYRKPSNTNIMIAPHSCHNPNIHAATFKGEICRASQICSSEEQPKK